MKKLLIALLAVSFAGSILAETCQNSGSKHDNSMSLAQCMTTTASAVSSVASTIYSVDKFSDVNKFENKHTISLYTNSDGKPLNSMPLERYLNSIQDGDKVTVHYQLNPEANRLYHIEHLKEKASNHRTLADSYAYKARHATKNAPGSGPGVKAQVPDYHTRENYRRLVGIELERGYAIEMEIERVKMGAPIPTYNLSDVISENARTKTTTLDMVRDKFAADSKVTRITRLPVTDVKALKSMTRKGYMGVAGVIVGLGLVIEEATTGKVAEIIEGSINEIELE